MSAAPASALGDCEGYEALSYVSAWDAKPDCIPRPVCMTSVMRLPRSSGVRECMA
jgi:hypothetical protein